MEKRLVMVTGDQEFRDCFFGFDNAWVLFSLTCISLRGISMSVPRCLTSRTATLWVTRIKTGTDQALPGSRWNWTSVPSLELWLGYLILWEKSESASIKMITCFTQNKSEQCLPLWSGHTLGHQVPGQLGCKWENGKSKSEIRKKSERMETQNQK